MNDDTTIYYIHKSTKKYIRKVYKNHETIYYNLFGIKILELDENALERITKQEFEAKREEVLSNY